MPKTEKHRGQDVTLNMIEKKSKELAEQAGIEPNAHSWDIAVENLYCHFLNNEGLTNTANEIMKHQTKDYLSHVHQPLIERA